MKRQLISLIIILPLLSLFPSLEIYAQGGGAELGPTGGKGSKTPLSGPVTPTLHFGVERKGKLDPRTSDKNASGGFFEEMILKDAKSEDLLSFQIESDNPSLGLQILGKNGAEVAVAKEPSGNFKISTPTGRLPANGDYRVRVTGVLTGRNAVPFRLEVNRLLTVVAYAERLREIDNDSTATVEKKVAVLEELVKLAPDDRFRSVTYGRLIDTYLARMDVVKAEATMDRMIKANGVIRIQIIFDNKWRPMAKSRAGGFDFADKRVGSLKIQAGQLTISDLRDKTLASLTGQQIGELSNTLVAAYNLVDITDSNKGKRYVFAPETMRQGETDLIIKMIKKHVKGLPN
jgi:hypothetical protein